MLKNPAMKFRLERHKGFQFEPEKAALLVIDMQNYFTNKRAHAYIPSSPDIIPPISKLIKAFERTRRPIYFTRHIDVDPNNMMSRWWQDRIEERDPLSEINDKIDKSCGEVIIKHHYDAFLATDLEERLRSDGIEQIVITGVVAHICCETTARSAFMKDFVPWIVTDGVTSYDRDHYEAALLNLSHAFAIPVESHELIAQLLPLSGDNC